MIRLYDILRSVDPSFPSMHAFICDDIANDLDGKDSPDLVNYPPEAYGRIAPPFPVFFVECATKALLSDYGIPLGNLADRQISVQRGILVRDCTNDIQVLANKHMRAGYSKPVGTRWVLTFHGYTRFDQGDIELFNGQAFMHLDREGRILDDTAAIEMVEYPDSMQFHGAAYLPMPILASYLPFVLFTMKALHDRCSVEYVKPSRQVRRHAERTEGITLHEHYILRIKTPTLQRRYPSTPRPTDVPKRAIRDHTVRSHFRFYTEEKPLFGRISGAVWIPQHTRGSKEVGSIEKDYRIVKGETESEDSTLV